MNRAGLLFKAIILLIGIAFSLIACGTADVTTRPTDMSGDQPEATGSSAPTLMGVRAETAGSQTKVVLEGNQFLTYTARLGRGDSGHCVGCRGPECPLKSAA